MLGLTSTAIGRCTPLQELQGDCGSLFECRNGQVIPATFVDDSLCGESQSPYTQTVATVPMNQPLNASTSAPLNPSNSARKLP